MANEQVSRTQRHGQQHHQHGKKKKKRSGAWRTILAVILLLVGIGLFAMDPIKNYLIQNAQKTNAVANLTREQIASNEKKEVTYNFSDIKPVNAVDVIKDHVNPKDLPTVGGIAIPSVKINLPIYKGVSNEGMYLGAGTLLPDQKMGESNYPLASHHTLHKDLLFSPLVNVKIGDMVYLTDLENVYKYEVTFYEQVDPSRVDVIEPTKDAIVTLITCDSSFTARVVVQGKLVDKKPIAQATQDMVKAFDMQQTVSAN